MTGKAEVYNKDAAISSGNTSNKVLEIALPFNFLKPSDTDVKSDGKKMFVSYLREELNKLARTTDAMPR